MFKVCSSSSSSSSSSSCMFYAYVWFCQRIPKKQSTTFEWCSRRLALAVTKIACGQMPYVAPRCLSNRRSMAQKRHLAIYGTCCYWYWYYWCYSYHHYFCVMFLQHGGIWGRQGPFLGVLGRVPLSTDPRGLKNRDKPKFLVFTSFSFSSPSPSRTRAAQDRPRTGPETSNPLTRQAQTSQGRPKTYPEQPNKGPETVNKIAEIVNNFC